MIIFNLESAVSVLLVSADAAASRRERIELLPEQWESGFGEEFYDHIVENEMFYTAGGPARQTRRPSVPAPGMAQYSVPTEEELLGMMEILEREAAAGHVGT